VISGQKTYRQYQDRKSTGNNRIGNLRQYQDREFTGNIRPVNLQVITGQEIYK
jgi:hypothetical protein